MIDFSVQPRICLNIHGALVNPGKISVVLHTTSIVHRSELGQPDISVTKNC